MYSPWQPATGNWQLSTGNRQLATGNQQLSTANKNKFNFTPQLPMINTTLQELLPLAITAAQAASLEILNVYQRMVSDWHTM